MYFKTIFVIYHVLISLLSALLYKSAVCLINRNTFQFACGPVSRMAFHFLNLVLPTRNSVLPHNSWGFVWGAVGPIKDDLDPELFL